MIGTVRLSDESDRCSRHFYARFENRLFKNEKKLAHDSFKLDETVGEFSKRVENTVEKGESAL